MKKTMKKTRKNVWEEKTMIEKISWWAETIFWYSILIPLNFCLDSSIIKVSKRGGR